MAEEAPEREQAALDEFLAMGGIQQKHAWFAARMQGMPAPSPTLLAGRAALRALPTFYGLASLDARAAIGAPIRMEPILPLFRAMLVAIAVPLAVARDRRRWKTTAQLAYSAADAVAEVFTGLASDVARSARSAALSATRVASDSTDYAAYTAARSVARSAASFAALFESDIAVSNIESFASDCARIGTAGDLSSRRALATSPLWLTGMPDRVATTWAVFRNELRSMEDGWSIWAEWSEGILAGARGGRFLFGLPTNRALKLWQDVALIDNATWEAGPATLNSEFRRLVDEALAESSLTTQQVEGDQPDALAPPPADIPSQNTKSSTFALTEDGRIGRAPVAPEQALLQSAAQLDRYAEMRTKLHELLELGDNSLGVLAKPATEFLKVLPEDLSQANADLLWARANKLRRLHRGHELALTDRDPNPARLAFDCGEALGDLIDMYNVFAFGDPAMTLRDATRFGPRDRADALAELASAKPVTDKALASEDVLTKEAHSDLSTQDANIKDLGEGIHSDQAVEQARIAKRNFIGTALSAAFDMAKKADGTLAGKNGGFAKETSSHLYKRALDGTLITLGVGASAAAAYRAEIVYFVLANADALKAYSAMYLQGSSAVRIVDWIRLQMEPKVE